MTEKLKRLAQSTETTKRKTKLKRVGINPGNFEKVLAEFTPLFNLIQQQKAAPISERDRYDNKIREGWIDVLAFTRNLVGATGGSKEEYDDPKVVAPLLFRTLDSRLLQERDQRGMPYLMPIPISWAKIKFSFLVDSRGIVKTSIESQKFSSWLLSLYADLCGMIELGYYTEVNRHLTPSYEGVTPVEILKPIEFACRLFGSENVYRIVDTTGIEFQSPLKSEIGDPVVVAVLDRKIYNICDYDTTTAEMLFAIS